ncbi:MAG: G8 domain-containing protein [Bacteroidota bacterium]
MRFLKIKSLLLISLLLIGQLRAQNPLNVAGTANTIATQSGDWSAPVSWGGSLPVENARILIPAGINIRLDQEILTEFKSIRIEGSLSFASDANTELRTEYLVSNPSGRLEIGTAANPVLSTAIAKLVFVDKGGTTVAEDPERFAPGAVLMGPVRMYGKEKRSWASLQIHPTAGSTSLVLEQDPVGWEPGDKIVVAATTLGDPASDDLVSISAINGRDISLNAPLTYNHQAPAQASDLKVHVANLSRNIKISSENTRVSAKRRGHLMFMHSLDVDMRFVELDHLGRTDKSIALDDYIWDDLQEDPTYVPPRGAYTNPRGRYSVHFHRGGFDPSLTPAHVEGVTVNSDPGWAFVNHSARVDFVRNVSYDVLGGAFMTEAGDETGSFIENIALRSLNPIDPLADPRAEEALVDIREEFQDYSWQGDAFWFHSNGITVKDNIAAGASGHAYIFWPEGLIENGLGMRRGDRNLHITDPAQRALLNGVDQNFVLECWLIPAKPFVNNTAYTVSKGLVGYYVQTRFLDETEEKNNVPTEAYRNSLQAVFDSSTIWNIRNKGIEFVFSSDISIQNSRIVGYGSPAEAYGIETDHWHNMDDWFFVNNKLEGFDNNNVAFSTPLNAEVSIDGGTFDNAATDILIYETNWPRGDADDEDEEIGLLNRTMIISNVNFLNPNRNIVLDARFSLNQKVQDGIDFPEDGKDIYYFLMNDQISLNYGPFQNATLYFDEQDANFTPINNSNFRLEVPPGDPPSDVIIPAQFRNKTNAQLQALTSNPSTSFGGELLPASAISFPGIIGGKVDSTNTTTSINDLLSEIEGLELYPVPAQEELQVKFAEVGVYEVEILTLRGAILQSDLLRDNGKLNLQNLASGFYLIRVRDLQANRTSIRKFIKQ